jgi:tRNA(Ile2) C34 agmatinyltransferase TiaS
MQNEPNLGPRGRRSEPRRCLMCGETFKSEGAHNRICPKCKLTRTWRSGGIDGITHEIKHRM